jgi:hypothetical protein
MRPAPIPRARARWYHWSDSQDTRRISIPARPAPPPQAQDRCSTSFDLSSAVYNGVLWTLGYALMLGPLAFLFILPHVLIVRWR